MPGIVCFSRAKQPLGPFSMHTVAVMRRMRNSVARLGTRYPLFFGSDPLDALTPGPGVLAPGTIRADGFDVLLGRMAELPRCVACRVTVQVGQSVVFRADGRIQHAECLPVICPV